MRPTRKRNADWEYKKTSLQDIETEEDFQIYLLAKPEQLKKYFIEEVPYFWVHHKITKDREFQKYLNELNNQLQVKGFPYVDNMLQILDSFTGNFKIICQIKDLQRILEHHNNNKRLVCIYVFDEDLKKASHSIRNKKIQTKCDDFKTLKGTVYRKKFDKNQVETFTNATRITNWDISQVNQSRLVLKTLLVSKNDRKGKQDFVKLATIVEQQHGRIAEYDLTYKIDFLPEQAVRWYTKQGFYHRLVNNTLKAGKGNPLFLSYIRFPVKQLYNSIKTIYQTKSLHKQSFECYRGGKINQTQLDYFQKNKKGFIEMQGFLSCSKNKKEMSDFIVNCVFKIIVSNLQRDFEWDHGFCFLDSNQLTEFVKQEEVLFNIFSVMEIKDVTKEVFNSREVDVITLEYGSLASLLYQKKHNLTLKDPTYSEICIRNYQALKPYYDSIASQVDCFKFFGKFKEVEEFYIKQLQFLQRQNMKDKNKQFEVYLNLGNNYLSLKSYVKAKQMFLKAKQISETKLEVKVDEITLSKMQNGLGIANKNLQKPIQAKSNYLKTIKLIQKSRNRNAKTYLATAYNNIAAILLEQSQQKQALTYYQKALNLLQGEENQTVGNVHYNLGLYNIRKHAYKQAVKNFIHSLQIYNKIFGTHKQTINCNIRLGQAYLKEGSSKEKYDKYFSAALDMMKNLAFSSKDEYFQIKRQIQDIKQKNRKNIQRNISTSFKNYQVEDFFGLMNKKDQIDRYMREGNTQRERFSSDHQVSSYPLKTTPNESIKNLHSQRQHTPFEIKEPNPQIIKGYLESDQKRRQMRAQNILETENAFNFPKNIGLSQIGQAKEELIRDISTKGESFKGNSFGYDKGYNELIDTKLGLFQNPSIIVNKPVSLSMIPASNINGISSNNQIFNDRNQVNSENFINDFYKNLKEGRKKKSLIF